MPTDKKKGKARASQTGNRARGKGKPMPADFSYVPKQKLVTTSRTSQRGRRLTKSTKARENSLQIEDADGDPDEDFVPGLLEQRRGPGRPPRQQVSNSAPKLTLSFNLPPPESPPHVSELTIDIHSDIVAVLTAINDHGSIVTELPSMQLPSRLDPDIDIEQPWTSANLFHLYIFSYSRRAYHVCDLIIDTWIREFHKVHETCHRVWRVNKSKYVHHGPIPDNDNGDPNISTDAIAFNSMLLRELYENTGSDCGARFLWADSMALCGSKLENRLDEQGGEKNWPTELIWDVMRTSLRLTRVRRTLKIEEKIPSAWCNRYHEHGKHGAPCYREVAAEAKAEAKEKEKRNERRQRAKSTDKEVEQNEDVVMMEMQDPNVPTGAGKQVSFVEGNEAGWREESEEA
ncbi:hypothetical protein K491DRAFT_125373 [Lophiostoma macrostomum CBS 122681]|uniref:Uncharacterized protein n=1 Tax=Lophiostoma macrostomum CBS 122681 TaxID=1314788 RepID=A0A6A6SVL8_9PLEO|nr:hypothetical protein K491DRAFT_125373 [Lophiostoma macrostomum CBS 122681]